MILQYGNCIKCLASLNIRFWMLKIFVKVYYIIVYMDYRNVGQSLVYMDSHDNSTEGGVTPAKAKITQNPLDCEAIFFTDFIL